MNKEIIEKLNALGGNTDGVSIGKTFAENWQSVYFNHYLYDKDWDVYGIDEFYEKNKDLYISNEDTFYKNLTDHYFSKHEQTYGQYFYKDQLFTPFKSGSDDDGELEGFVDEDEIRTVVDGSEMEFICIFYSYGYPDHFYVCLTDPDQLNPTVYGTDHEAYFQEIENEGRLEDFLGRFMTKKEFSEVVRTYLADKVEK